MDLYFFEKYQREYISMRKTNTEYNSVRDKYVSIFL